MVRWKDRLTRQCNTNHITNLMRRKNKLQSESSLTFLVVNKIFETSRKYTIMFKTNSFLGNKNLSLNQNVWRDATGCFVAFLGDISTWKSGWSMKKTFCCPALELFHCLPLWKTVLFVSSRAFSLSTPTFSLSTPVENSEATRKKATKCNKQNCFRTPKFLNYIL